MVPSRPYGREAPATPMEPACNRNRHHGRDRSGERRQSTYVYSSDDQGLTRLAQAVALPDDYRQISHRETTRDPDEVRMMRPEHTDVTQTNQHHDINSRNHPPLPTPRPHPPTNPLPTEPVSPFRTHTHRTPAD